MNKGFGVFVEVGLLKVRTFLISVKLFEIQIYYFLKGQGLF